jgi:protein gp37
VAQLTAIEWTDLSWNPVHGCSKVSPGCAHCYAETLSLRYGHTEKPWTPENAADNVILKPQQLRQPLSNAQKWLGLGEAAAAAGKTEGKLVFVNSMSDLFHELVPVDFIAKVFAVMCVAGAQRDHAFQILTKRPERMRDILSDRDFWPLVFRHAGDLPRGGDYPAPIAYRDARWMLDNVWLGVSIENRRFVERASILRQTPAAVRFISAEPLLGPLVPATSYSEAGYGSMWHDGRGGLVNLDEPGIDLTGIDQVIVGGESGPGHRRFDWQWARDLRDAARDADCAFFMKQGGGQRPGDRLEDLPDDLQIREFPKLSESLA